MFNIWGVDKIEFLKKSFWNHTDESHTHYMYMLDKHDNKSQ